MAAAYRRVVAADGGRTGRSPAARQARDPPGCPGDHRYCGRHGGGGGRPTVVGWRLHRRQLLGGGLLGAAGAALGPSGVAGRPVGRPGRGPAGVGCPGGRPTVPAPTGPGPPMRCGSAGLAAPLGLGGGRRLLLLAAPGRPARCPTERLPDRGDRARWSVPVRRPWSGTAAGWPRPSRPSSPTPARRWPPTPPTAGPCRPGTASGEPGPPSAAATFETGLADRDWTASWIRRAGRARPRSPTSTPTPAASSRSARAAIVRARAYVSGDQQYELYVNGDAGREGPGLQLSRTRSTTRPST